MAQVRVLLADDDPFFCEVFQKALALQGWDVEVAGDGQQALDMLCKHPYDVAVLDFKMPHLDGLEVLRAVREERVRTAILILTGYGDEEMSFQAGRMGAQKFLNKPILPLDLVAEIREAMDSRLPPHAFAARLDRFMEAHASDPSLTFDALCRHFRRSARSLSDLFRTYLNASFRRRLAYHRVEKAKQLLESTDDPLYLIAEQCGFKNYRRLTETFQREAGMSPRQYRKICADRRTNCR